MDNSNIKINIINIITWNILIIQPTIKKVNIYMIIYGLRIKTNEG